MAKKKNGNKMWIAGAVLGAVAGAAYALWKTPMSGQELRGRLASGPVAQRDDISTDKTYTPGTADKILTRVEQTLAPLVGVELGKTANGNGVSDTDETERVVAAEPKVPEAPFEAADATPDPGSDRTTSGTGVRAKRFAWGEPAPEAGAQTFEEDPVTEPAHTREPAAPSRLAPPNDGAYGMESIRAQRFSWGEPAPEATDESDDKADQADQTDQPRTDQLATAGSTTGDDESRPVEPVTGEATKPGNKMRQFPKLGGLE